jgi:8-oxo-dGTP pyrophosphatase MutT (NUDIX family)
MTVAEKQMRAIERGLASPVPALQGARRAVVACILRRPLPRAASAGLPLQMLFILRAAKAGSRFSGQVGFPGGHVEAGESDDQAVAREVREEVGLDLQRDGHFRHLGEVKQRQAHNLVVCCHVYEQRVRSALRGSDLQDAEVAAAGWTPLTALTGDDCLGPVGHGDWSQHGSDWDVMPAVRLPFADGDVAVADGATIGARRMSEVDARAAFSLWGLTLGIVNDLLVGCGLRTGRIDDTAVAAAARHRGGGREPSEEAPALSSKL